MNDYDIWMGLTDFTLFNYFLGIGLVSLVIWACGGFRNNGK